MELPIRAAACVLRAPCNSGVTLAQKMACAKEALEVLPIAPTLISRRARFQLCAHAPLKNCYARLNLEHLLRRFEAQEGTLTLQQQLSLAYTAFKDYAHLFVRSAGNCRINAS